MRTFKLVDGTIYMSWMGNGYATITLGEDYQAVVTRTGPSEILPERQIKRWLPTLQGYVNRMKVRIPDRAELLRKFFEHQGVKAQAKKR